MLTSVGESNDELALGDVLGGDAADERVPIGVVRHLGEQAVKCHRELLLGTESGSLHEVAVPGPIEVGGDDAHLDVDDATGVLELLALDLEGDLAEHVVDQELLAVGAALVGGDADPVLRGTFVDDCVERLAGKALELVADDQAKLAEHGVGAVGERLLHADGDRADAPLLALDDPDVVTVEPELGPAPFDPLLQKRTRPDDDEGAELQAGCEGERGRRLAGGGRRAEAAHLVGDDVLDHFLLERPELDLVRGDAHHPADPARGVRDDDVGFEDLLHPLEPTAGNGDARSGWESVATQAIGNAVPRDEPVRRGTSAELELLPPGIVRVVVGERLLDADELRRGELGDRDGHPVVDDDGAHGHRSAP